MKNVTKTSGIIGLILGGMLIIVMIIYSPIELSLDICNIIFGAVSGILLCLVNCIITLSISKISAYYLYRKKNKQYWLLQNKILICICFVYNVFIEELVFRSYLFSFINENWGNISAISITTILFIFYHQRPRIIELGLMGITFGVLVIITNNIITPIMAHLSINLIYLGYKYKKNKKNIYSM
jgi:membrane protease YdiL (CAAX protease family)